MQADIADVWPGTIAVSGPVTSAVIREVISEAEKRLPKPITVQEILRAVAAVHGVSVADLKGPSRRRDLTDARVQAARLVRAVGHITLNEPARELNRDPSSLCHAIRRRSP